MSYTLVNPYTYNKFISNNNDLFESASDIWAQLSKNTKKYVDNSYFSIIDKNNKLSHFSVNEKLEGGNVIYNIDEYDNHDNDQKFLNILYSLDKNIGGKKHKHHKKDNSSSSSSSSSSEDLSIFKFKPKKNIIYSSLSTKPMNSYVIEYYNIYSTRLVLPYFFSKYTVSLNPFLIIE